MLVGKDGEIRKRLALVLFLVILVHPGMADDDQESPLAGLWGVFPVVEELGPVQEGGLSRDALETEVELLLRQYGIPVLTRQEWRESRAPYLYVNVYTRIQETGHGREIGFFSVVRVELKDFACLARDVEKGNTRNRVFVVTSWESGTRMCLGPPSVQREDTVECLRIQMKEFIKDYLAANPKKQGQPDSTTDG